MPLDSTTKRISLDSLNGWSADGASVAFSITDNTTRAGQVFVLPIDPVVTTPIPIGGQFVAGGGPFRVQWSALDAKLISAQ